MGVQLSEIELMSGGTRVDYTGATALVAGARVDGNVPRWIDGSLNPEWYEGTAVLGAGGGETFWAAAWITIDFGTSRTADSFRFGTARGDSIPRDPVRWVLQGSDNNSTWTTIHDQSGSDASITDTRSAWTQAFLFT